MTIFLRIRSSLTSFTTRHPLVTNCVSYGGICGMAELTQQTIEAAMEARKKRLRKDDCFNLGSVSRYTTVGTFVMAPTLHLWYKFLDTLYPGTAWRALATKLVLDCTVITIPLYALFYAATSALEGQTDIFREMRQKFLLTYTLAICYWTPLQAVNFAVVPPANRVVFVAVCTFIEVNGLCLLKRWKVKDEDA